MAYNRLSEQKIIDTSVGGVVAANLILLNNAELDRYHADEQRFLNAVLEDNLSLTDQLEYRREQLKRIKPAAKDEKDRVRNEIASLQDLIEQDEFKNKFLDQLSAQNNGMQSIDATIRWLNSRLKNTTDPKIQSDIRGHLNTLEASRQTLARQTLDQMTTYATNDKSEQTLSDQIDKVGKARSQAIISGDDNYVSVLDLQLQSLTKALTESRVERALMNFSTNTIIGRSAVSMLDSINKEIAGANPDMPITIGSTRYNSAKEFWETKRSEYLNDRGENGFFTRYSDELSKNLEYKVSRGTFRTDTLGEVSSAYDGIKSRPELVPYADKIEQDKQSVMNSAAQTRATQVVNQFSIDLNAERAVRELSNIQSVYGVDVTTAYQQIVLQASKEKEEQIRSILSATSQIMTNTPGISQEEAFKQAVMSGAGASYSPEQLAEQTATEIAGTATKQGAAGEFTDTSGPASTIKPETAAPFSQPAYEEGGYYKTPKSATVYKYESGKLRPITGNFTNDEFKQVTGKTFAEVQQVGGFGNTPIGSSVDKVTLIPPAPATPSTPLATPPAPAPQTSFQTYKVIAGDTLSKIAQRFYNDPKKFQSIFDANKDLLKDPNKIKPGQEIKIPKL